ncbi:MAG TPA: hypothetical protein VE377_06230 [Candidatus Dormibacteraeota bacterium]|nr:hypothetical protein [Candidatus Dormibacteraeota bacterium]
MKTIKITSTAILSLLLAAATPLYAQHEQQGEKQDHPRQGETRHESAKPQPQHTQQKRSEPTHQQSSHVQQADRQKPSGHTQKQPQHAQRQQESGRPQHAQQQRQQHNNQPQHAQNGNGRHQRSPEEQRVQHSAWQQHRSQHWDSDHRNWQQRGGYHGYRIPDDRFRGYFGQDHGFRIYGLPFLVVGGYPRFQYHGYWLSAVDPWPEYWGDNWYDNDDVYVTYVDNGYYLYNRRYPNVGIAISISM